MKIGILGTGTLATAMATVWAGAGHELRIGGRSPQRAATLAERIGGQAMTPREAVTGSDAVLLAVSWTGVEQMLLSAGAAEGSLDRVPLIDPSNAVEHGVGVLLTDPGISAARQIAAWAPGAHVVKAFHLFAAGQWLSPDRAPVTLAICGDDPGALTTVSQLAHDAGATPTVLGPLSRARQLEEVAGFVIGLAFAGVDPRSAVPHVPV